MKRPTGYADTFQWQDYADYLEEENKALKASAKIRDHETSTMMMSLNDEIRRLNND